MHIKPLSALPTVKTYDWAAVAEHVLQNGPMYVTWELTAAMHNAARAAMHRKGVSIYQVKNAEGTLICYSFERLRSPQAVTPTVTPAPFIF